MLLTLEEFYKRRKNDEKEYLGDIAEGGDSLNWSGMLETFWNFNRCFGVVDVFVNRDMAAAKQHFYMCGRLDELQVGICNSRFFEYNLEKIGYAILSDDSALLQRYSRLQFKEDELGRPAMDVMVRQGEGPIYVHCLQMIIREDWENLSLSLELMEKTTLPKASKLLRMDYAFYKGMLQKDKSAIEAVLDQMVAPAVHKKRNENELFAQYVSMPALGYAKLAWQKGIPVEVDSLLIPKDLLPVRPLEKYVDSYEFLKRFG
jgi:hypothetical protein